MASERRIEKLSELLKEETAKIIARELELPHETLVTITRVEVSRDARYAAIFISLLCASPEETLEIIKKHTYTTQQTLNRRLRMRPVPQIHFVLDEGEIRREGVEKSLAKLKRKGEV